MCKLFCGLLSVPYVVKIWISPNFEAYVHFQFFQLSKKIKEQQGLKSQAQIENVGPLIN